MCKRQTFRNRNAGTKGSYNFSWTRKKQSAMHHSGNRGVWEQCSIIQDKPLCWAQHQTLASHPTYNSTHPACPPKVCSIKMNSLGWDQRKRITRSSSVTPHHNLHKGKFPKNPFFIILRSSTKILMNSEFELFSPFLFPSNLNLHSTQEWATEAPTLSASFPYRKPSDGSSAPPHLPYKGCNQR